MTSSRSPGPARTRDAAATRGALVRYFGNKAGLFAEAIRGQAMALLDAGPRRELLERTVASMFDAGATAEAGPLLAVLRGASSSQIGAEVRLQLAEAYTSAFAELVDSDPADAVLRAELFLSWLLGVSLLRSVELPGHAVDDVAAQAHVLRAARALLGPLPAALDSGREHS